MGSGGMGTYFLVWLTQSPDTPPGSGSKTPSQMWRSVRWNMPVRIYHSLDSETAGSDAAAHLQRPSQVRTPPNFTWDKRVCVSSYLLHLPIKPAHWLCSRRSRIIHVSSMLLLPVTHTLTHTVSFFPCSNATAAVPSPARCV